MTVSGSSSVAVLEAQLVEVLRLRLRGRASDAMMKNLIQLIEQGREDPVVLRKNIDKIRTTMRLFVDETLAEVVRNSLLFVLQKTSSTPVTMYTDGA